MGKIKEILDVELWVILTALKIALKETLDVKCALVTIFSNSQRALRVVGEVIKEFVGKTQAPIRLPQ